MLKPRGSPTPSSRTVRWIEIVLAASKADEDLAAALAGKGVLEGVGDELVDDQPAGDGRLDVQEDLLGLQPDADRGRCSFCRDFAQAVDEASRGTRRNRSARGSWTGRASRG